MYVIIHNEIQLSMPNLPRVLLAERLAQQKTAPVRARLYRLRRVADGAFTAALAPLRAGLRQATAPVRLQIL